MNLPPKANGCTCPAARGPTLTPELLADLRKKAEAARDSTNAPIARIWLPDGHLLMRIDDAVLVELATPPTVLALLDRIAELEAKYVAPSQWRCDGCGCIERPDDGRRPDRHEGCGGYWVRQERTG